MDEGKEPVPEIGDMTWGDPTRNLLPPAYRLHPWERWEYIGFVVGGFLAHVSGLGPLTKPRIANIYRYPMFCLGLGGFGMWYQNYLKKREMRKTLIYLDYTKKHPEEFVRLESRTLNETWDEWGRVRGA